MTRAAASAIANLVIAHIIVGRLLIRIKPAASDADGRTIGELSNSDQQAGGDLVNTGRAFADGLIATAIVSGIMFALRSAGLPLDIESRVATLFGTTGPV